MYVGTALGGAELFPGSVANELPQVVAGLPVGSVATSSAKPLNAGGAAPALTPFSPAHWLPHQSSVVPRRAAATERSPSTNAPRLGNAKTTTDALSADGR